jgi:hypothetical protein
LLGLGLGEWGEREKGKRGREEEERGWDGKGDEIRVGG